ncbi:Hypothetical predicted protein [Pelobates cultripes]|uniref:Uncharacterized protein n=1 Tax=Pelobates cultripes TaxID=61616 RepID=A0AAD1T284_PELCU|nr:Hypothetical predicted protein [Pelobates cultripes]
MAGAMCMGGRKKTCTIFVLAVDNGAPTPQPCNREGRTNHHLPPHPHMPKSSGTSNPSKRIMATTLGGRDVAPLPLPPGKSMPATKRATSARGPTSHSPATQPASPRHRQRQTQVTKPELPVRPDTIPPRRPTEASFITTLKPAFPTEKTRVTPPIHQGARTLIATYLSHTSKLSSILFYVVTLYTRSLHGTYKHTLTDIAALKATHKPAHSIHTAAYP